MSNPLTAARGTGPDLDGALRCVLPKPPEQKLRPDGPPQPVRAPRSRRRSHP